MPPPVRFGYGFDLRNPRTWHKPLPELYAETLDFIDAIESMGFESIWLAEHHGIDDDYLPSPLTFAAAVAARTKTLRISTGVALAPFYHPVRLAEDLAVLDLISNGRIDFAPGVGYLPWEAAAYGFDFGSRGRMTDEILQILRRLWSGEAVTFKGEFFDLKEARCRPLTVQKPGIPLFIGGTARPGFRRAARLGDGFIGPLVFWPEYLQELRACGKSESEGRIVSMDASDMWMLVTDDPEKTLNEVAPHTHYQVNQYARWQAHEKVGVQEMDLETFKKSGMTKVLTPEQAIDYLRSRMELAPIEAFCMQAPAGFPLSKLLRHAELFATRVMPALRAPR
jgi:alkanesulfonate monooxygenase SsuD/methylene tetrahydromethanopterin reductase-like flavin-dependent oxidoreductase (luciferase family)